MKKSIIIILTILISAFAFSLDVNKIENYYTTFIQEYNKNDRNGELSDFYNLIDNLGLYRFYRNIMVGTAEYTDRPSDIQRYLTNIHDQLKFENPEEKIAYAGFMAYFQSKISSDPISQEMIRSLPAYFTSIQDYKSNVENEVLTYLGNVIGYSLGVLEDSPYKDIKRFNSTGKIVNRDFYVYKGEPNKEYNQIIEENKDKLLSEIQALAKENLTDEDLEFAIDDISYQYIDSVTSLIDNQIQDTLKMFVKKADTAFNPNFIRLIVYLVAIIIFFIFLRKYMKYLILAIYAFELFFLIFIYNPIQDPITSFIYGALVIVAVSVFFIASLLKAFGRDVHIFERLKNVTIFIAIILIISLPAYSVTDLLMKNNENFNKSIFESQLLKDTVTYQSTGIQRIIGSLKSDLGLEFSEMRSLYNAEMNGFINNSLTDGIYDHLYADLTDGIDIAVNKDGLIFNNRDNYMSNAKNLSKSIDEIVSSAKIRQKRINNSLATLKENIKKVLLYSNDQFKNTVENSVDEQFKGNDLLKNINIDSYFNIEPLKQIDLKAYNTVHGTIFIVAFLFSFLIYIIFEEKLMKILSTLGMVIASIMAFIAPTTITVLSQINYPPLTSSDYSVNYFIGILMLFITAIIQIKKEKKIALDKNKKD